MSTAATDRGDVMLRVRDTGIGMSEKDIETALQPFRQLTTSPRTDANGTGLGLPLTKALVEANRARFSIKSAVNAGTLVEIVFPAARGSCRNDASVGDRARGARCARLRPSDRSLHRPRSGFRYVAQAYAVTADACRACVKRRGEKPVGRKIGFTNRDIWDAIQGRLRRSGATCTSIRCALSLLDDTAFARALLRAADRAGDRVAGCREPRKPGMDETRTAWTASNGSRTASRSCNRSFRAGDSRSPTPSRTSACTARCGSAPPLAVTAARRDALISAA